MAPGTTAQPATTSAQPATTSALPTTTAVPNTTAVPTTTTLFTTTSRLITTTAPKTTTLHTLPSRGVTSGGVPSAGVTGTGVTSEVVRTAAVLRGLRVLNMSGLPPRLGYGTLPMPKTPTTTAAATLSAKTAVRAREVPSPHRPAKVAPSRPKLGHDVLAIGDSVLVAASASLQQRLHGDITIDAVVGRQVWSGIARLAAYKAAGDLVGLKAVIIDLGTNGPMTPQDVAQFRALSAGVPLLVFVNVRVPLPWQSESNASLSAVAGQRGIAVVNWYSASAAPGVLWPDAIHPDPKGQVLYANLVAAALAPRGQKPHPAAAPSFRGASPRQRILQNG